MKIVKVKATFTPKVTRTKEMFAQRLRDNPTQSEAILCDELTRLGYQFEFQEIVLGYIPDFYFPAQQKIVELDGKKFHDEAKDAIRDENFRRNGIQTLRISSSRVFNELHNVLRAIEIFIKGSSKSKKKRNKKGRRYMAYRKAMLKGG